LTAEKKTGADFLMISRNPTKGAITTFNLEWGNFDPPRWLALHYYPRFGRSPFRLGSSDDRHPRSTAASNREAVLRFPGTHWTVLIDAEYDFESKSNARAACIWIVLGGAFERFDRSLAFVRSADLDPASHHLSLMIHHRPDEPVGKTLTNHPTT
jgi:hypothetical protein